MKITSKILSIPPYISTRWEQVGSIRAIGEDAIEVSLISGISITIPHLTPQTIEQIFTSHLQAAETDEEEVKKEPAAAAAAASSSLLENSSFVKQEELSQFLQIIQHGLKELCSLILKLGAQSVSSLGKALEHDPKNKDLPPLTDEMREKIILLLNVIPREDLLAMNPPEVDCNCMYCQISRILRNAIADEERKRSSAVPNQELKEEEDIVDEKELQFSEWIVTPLSEKLFSVKNKLNLEEEYRVFLGNPVGCTCGKPNCDHIIAVLRS